MLQASDERVGYWTRTQLVAMNNRALARMAMTHPTYPAAVTILKLTPAARKRRIVSRQSAIAITAAKDAKRTRGYFLLRRDLGHLIGVAPKTGTDILAEVARKHGLTVDTLRARVRTRQVAGARHEAAYRIISETRLSYPQVGRLMNRDHTSILHSVEVHARENGLPTVRRVHSPQLVDRHGSAAEKG